MVGKNQDWSYSLLTVSIFTLLILESIISSRLSLLEESRVQPKLKEEDSWVSLCFRGKYPEYEQYSMNNISQPNWSHLPWGKHVIRPLLYYNNPVFPCLLSTGRTGVCTTHQSWVCLYSFTSSCESWVFSCISFAGPTTTSSERHFLLCRRLLCLLSIDRSRI